MHAGVLSTVAMGFVMALLAQDAFALSKTARNAARMPATSDATTLGAIKNASPFGMGAPYGARHHDGQLDHLPGVQKNMELVGELNLISPTTGNPLSPGQVADVAVHKGYAYVNS